MLGFFQPAADRYRISDQSVRGTWLQLVEIVVCGVVGHRAGVLHYDTFFLEERYDEDDDEIYEHPVDTETPYLGCLRCLAEVELALPPAIPVDIVDWR
ncbi:hypothetical protein [Microbacterium sp. 77mftsu3.1]|uniref:hypothetical protein n=1 Tax=Microbacterium sp. 77mftsu3.1 TaxID=1761802 RepID=UPI00035CF384|nr:hypothetical protein [Microbacterium sp. 77mftsu3.1]SDH50458.1 hypothetical protein SAMN04488590_3468 [Microbacterium sp. 77mftsu3.1]